jgi:hypothetical protein
VHKKVRGLVGLAAVGALAFTPLVASTAAAAGAVGNSPVHLLGRVHNIQQSENWSGYVITGSGYHTITAAWVVPKVKPSSGNTYSSSWVGIDGDGNSDLIQTGTEADYTGGSAKYDAWWEILPASETVIPSITVHPGNIFTASINQVSGTNWTITINNTSTGQSFTTNQTYTGPGASAEWIVERPEVGFRLSTLANYGKDVFNKQDTLNGANPGFTTADEIEMTNNTGTQVLSIPSDPNVETNGFVTAYGSTKPAPPA